MNAVTPMCVCVYTKKMDKIELLHTVDRQECSVADMENSMNALQNLSTE